MHEYSVFADLMSTFRSLHDGIKALIVIGFYTTLITAIVIWGRRKHRHRRPSPRSHQLPTELDIYPPNRHPPGVHPPQGTDHAAAVVVVPTTDPHGAQHPHPQHPHPPLIDGKTKAICAKGLGKNGMSAL